MIAAWSVVRFLAATFAFCCLVATIFCVPLPLLLFLLVVAICVCMLSGDSQGCVVAAVGLKTCLVEVIVWNMCLVLPNRRGCGMMYT